MRCPDCNKFVSMDTETDPEAEDPAVDEEGFVTCQVRIVNNCADCGTELKEATFDLEADTEAGTDHKGKGHSLEVETEDVERTERSEGRGRGLRSFYGVSVSFTVKCECGETWNVKAEDDVQASSMEELS